jgi:hypothetical protein
MNPVRDLLSDLETTIRANSTERRLTTLRQVTELFLGEGDRLSEEQVAIFDAVFVRLAEVLETGARADLARRLAPHERAPPGIIGALAKDAIEVARPVLVHSPRLRDGDLLAIAGTAGNDHRQAIAGRRQLSAAVVGALVARGDLPTMRAVAANQGACLSPASLAVLIDRARLDEELARLLQSRTDLPPAQLRRLIDLAQEASRRKFAGLPGNLREMLEKAHTRSFRQLRALAGSLDYRDAIETIGAIEVSRRIREEDVADFAASEDLEATVCAVAACARISLAAAERLFTRADSDLVLIIAKAKGWKWSTLQRLLRLRDPDSMLPHNALRLARTFAELAPEAADRALRKACDGGRGTGDVGGGT